MATEATTVTETNTTSRGIQLPCPRCGESQANLLLHLVDMEMFTCCECDGEFSRADIEEIVERWAPLLKWLDAAPTSN